MSRFRRSGKRQAFEGLGKCSKLFEPIPIKSAGLEYPDAEMIENCDGRSGRAQQLTQVVDALKGIPHLFDPLNEGVG